MPWNGSGSFSLTYTWATEAGSPPIAISKLDTQEGDIADGLENCLTRDGQNSPSAAIPFNAQRLTNLGAATSRTDGCQAAQVQDGSFLNVGTVAGTDTITGVLAPAITAYAAGQKFVFEPAATNTGAATINLNSVGAVAIVKHQGAALVAGDLVSGVPALIVYDGTQFYVLNPQTFVIQQNAQTGNYTLVLADGGKHIYHASGAGAGDTYTIPANSSVAFPVGTSITFVNKDSNSVSIAITTDTMTLAGTTTTGTRALAQNGVATALKDTATSWVISGVGLS